MSYFRMSAALVRLESKENCVSQYIYHKLMGHDVDDILFKVFCLFVLHIEIKSFQIIFLVGYAEEIFCTGITRT